MGTAAAGAHDFAVIELTARRAKPRTTGITIAIEFGLGIVAQRDWLDIAANSIDMVKIAVSIAGLIEPKKLAKKIRVYRQYEVTAFPGGMFLEYAFAKGVAQDYLRSAKDVGFDTIEVSDNAVPLGGAVKIALVRQAQDLGLVVLGEVGSKHEISAVAALISEAQQLLEAGCSRVLIEAAEIIGPHGVRADLIDAIESSLPLGQIIFELPGPWLPGVHQHQVVALEAWLVERFGADVNIANDPIGNSLFLEAYRRGIGPNMLMAARS